MQKWHKLVNKNSSECRKLCPALKISKREDPQTPSLMCPHPTTLPPCQSSPHSLFTLVGLRYGRVQSRQTGSNRYTTRLFISLIWNLFFLMCPQFSVLSSFCLLSSPKAETVAKQPAQHNTAALQLGSALAVPLWFQTIKYTGACECACTCSHRKRVWKVRAMNSFHLISKSQQSL